MSSSAQAKQIYPYASFLCTLQVRFLLTPFPIVSVAVWITVFTRFYRCWIYFNRLQNLNGAKLFGIWIIERTSNTNKVYRGYLCCVTMSRLPFIAVYNSFCRCLYYFNNYFVFETFICCLFWRPWVAQKDPLIESRHQSLIDRLMFRWPLIQRTAIAPFNW